MDTRDVVARLEEDIARLRRQNHQVRAYVIAVTLVAIAPWLMAAASQAPARPAGNAVTADRLILNGPNGPITLRSMEAVSTLGADNNRPAPALGIFAGLSWPLLLLGGATLTVPYFVLGPAGEGGTAPGAAWLLLLVPAGTITFALWAIRAAARWGSNQPPTHRRGVLKWVFLGLLACGVGAILARSRPERRVAPSAARGARR